MQVIRLQWFFNGLELCDFDKRAYDSQTGRFNQTDILADQRNNLSPYNYCSNNPINRTDPTGMIDSWYNNENNQSTFDKNINSQADMTKAGINGTFIGKEALVVDNTDNTMKWGNSDGTLSGINLPEVVVSAERGGSSSDMSNKLNTANDVFNYAGYGEAGIGAIQIGMIQYRQAQPILDRIGNLSEFSSAYRALGTTGKVLGRASYVGSVLSVGLDYKAMQDGEIGIGRFIYRTTGLGAAIATGAAIGGPWGAIGGAGIGGGVWAGEKSYDGFQFWLKEMNTGMSNIERALKNGWTPR